MAQGEPDPAAEEDNHAKRWKLFESANLDELVEEGESRTTFMLRYTLSHPHSDTNIVGTRRVNHLEENVAGIKKGPLSADVYAEAKRRLDAAGEKPEAVRDARRVSSALRPVRQKQAADCGISTESGWACPSARSTGETAKVPKEETPAYSPASPEGTYSSHD